MHARYFTPYEVAQHNSPTDCWVSVFNTVYDLTSLLKVCTYFETDSEHVHRTNVLRPMTDPRCRSSSRTQAKTSHIGPSISYKRRLRSARFRFDVSTQDVRSRICIDSGRRVPYCPQVRCIPRAFFTRSSTIRVVSYMYRRPIRAPNSAWNSTLLGGRM